MKSRSLAEPLPFDEAIEFFQTKVAMLPEEFEVLADECRTRAFTVAGIASLDALKSLLDLLNQAIEDGLTLQEFQAAANEELAKRGYKGLTPYRADNIFRTNMQTAFQVGRYRQLTDPDIVRRRPYWQYDAVLDERTRPTHRALDGTVRRADDPFWDTWYPPNGYRCRCSVRSLSDFELEREGLTVETGAPTAVIDPYDGSVRQLLPDPGWDTNPGKHAWEPDMSQYPADLKAAYESRSATRSQRPFKAR